MEDSCLEVGGFWQSVFSRACRPSTSSVLYLRPQFSGGKEMLVRLVSPQLSVGLLEPCSGLCCQLREGADSG